MCKVCPSSPKELQPLKELLCPSVLALCVSIPSLMLVLMLVCMTPVVSQFRGMK